MNSDDVPVKTQRGVEALRTRSAELPQRLRTVLILVDGSRSVADLRLAASQAGAPAASLETLLEQGLVQMQQMHLQPGLAREPAAPAQQPRQADMAPVQLNESDRYAAAVRIINEAVVDAMGLRAFFMSLKIEKCASPGDLLALLPEIVRAVEKSRGAFVSDALNLRIRNLLQ